MNAAERRKHGKEIAVINRRLERQWMPKVRAALKYNTAQAVLRVRSQGLAAAAQWLNTQIINPRLGPIMRALYRQVGLRHARKLNAQLQAEPMQAKRDGRLGLNQQWIDFIQEYLERDNLSKLVLQVSRTNRAILLKAMQEAVDRGLGIDEAVRLIQNWPGTEYQAARIVRTEVNRAANVGMMAASKTFPFEQVKEWISAEDNRVRGRKPEDHASHVALDSMVVGENDTWTDPRNGDELRFPGDPEASAASTINCRCTMGITAKRDADGRLIRKQRTTSRISVILPGTTPRRQIITV